MRKGARSKESLDENGDTPLLAALCEAKLALATRLVTGGANVNAISSNADTLGYTPLHHVACLGSKGVPLARRLLAQGADPTATNATGETPAELARARGLRVLLEQAAKQQPPKALKRKTSRAKRSELTRALHRASDPLEVKQLIERGAAPNAPDEEGYTPLHSLAEAEWKHECVAALLRFGASLTHRDHAGAMPLHRAALSGNLYSVKYLLEAGAQLSAKDSEGRSPLVYAVLKSSSKYLDARRFRAGLEIIRELIANGADAADARAAAKALRGPRRTRLERALGPR